MVSLIEFAQILVTEQSRFVGVDQFSHENFSFIWGHSLRFRGISRRGLYSRLRGSRRRCSRVSNSQGRITQAVELNSPGTEVCFCPESVNGKVSTIVERFG